MKRMAASMEQFPSVKVRPHVKAHKTPQIARMQEQLAKVIVARTNILASFCVVGRRGQVSPKFHIPSQARGHGCTQTPHISENRDGRDAGITDGCKVATYFVT